MSKLTIEQFDKFDPFNSTDPLVRRVIATYTKDETKAIASVIEECSEVQQCLTKFLRMGYTMRSIEYQAWRDHLISELGDLLVTLTWLLNRFLIGKYSIVKHIEAKCEYYELMQRCDNFEKGGRITE